MTVEEKQKAMDALKISAPVMAVTQEEFKDYIQILNKIMNWLEQETVSKESYDNEYFLRKDLEMKIAKLEQQEPKTGHWIYDKKSDLSKCSICGAYCPHDELGRIETLTIVHIAEQRWKVRNKED